MTPIPCAMNKAAVKIAQLFFVITITIALVFPDKVFGNVYFLLGYLVVTLVIIYFVFFAKPKKQE